MRRDSDPLYDIFERHLFNSLVEDESTDLFLQRVVEAYLRRLTSSGTVIPNEFRSSIEGDLRDEILQMLRKKTYGYFNLAEFRKAKATEPVPTPAPEKKKARRARRAC